jgi:Sigma-70, region 4
MDALTPAERVSFVLHDVFDMPFDTIAAILGRSTASAKMLASRARGRIRLGAPAADSHSAARGALITARGRPFLLMAFTVEHGRISTIRTLSDPKRLAQLVSSWVA